jgi:predicted house-cleaning noncanonical NTP pyrophosphatase (MazG superfamily)
MAVFELNKLVRDGIPARMEADGQTPIFKVLEGKALLKAKLEKLAEETNEALLAFDNPEALTNELKDIHRIWQSVVATKEIEKALLEGDDESKGDFTKGYWLERVDVPEGSKWNDYYRQDPQRFPEVGIDPLESITLPMIQVGQYRHYKGGLYEVLGVACHSETLSAFIVYKPLYDHEGKPGLWIRPYDMFVGLLNDGTQRFNKL